MVAYEHTPVPVSDKRVVVAGGTNGIGQAVTLEFTSEGADVLATSRHESAVDEMADIIGELGASAVWETCNVTDSASLEHVRERAAEEFDDVDVVVASQGTISRETVYDIDSGAWGHVTDIALGDVRCVTQELAPAVANGGLIINISSLAARLSVANLPIYSAAKGGVEAFTRVSAEELTPEVRVNVIAPSFVITPQNADTYAKRTEKCGQIDERTSFGRVTEWEGIVGAAVFPAGGASSFVADEVVTIDGGFADSMF